MDGPMRPTTFFKDILDFASGVWKELRIRRGDRLIITFDESPDIVWFGLQVVRISQVSKRGFQVSLRFDIDDFFQQNISVKNKIVEAAFGFNRELFNAEAEDTRRHVESLQPPKGG